LILILIASGWAIDYFELKDMDLYVPLVLIIAVLHALIVGLGKINNEEHTKFHDYESLPGWIIIVLKFIFFGIFWYFGKETLNKLENDGKDDVDKIDLVKRILFWGSVYLLSFPIIVITTSIMIEPYLRHKVITVGSIILQVIVSMILTYLFSSKRSQYFQFSWKNKTLLPSDKLD